MANRESYEIEVSRNKMTKHEHQWVKVSESENYYKFSCGLCNQTMRAKK